MNRIIVLTLISFSLILSLPSQVSALCSTYNTYQGYCGSERISPFVMCGIQDSSGNELCCNTLEECASTPRNPANKPAESDGIASSYLNSLNTQIGGKYDNTNLISGVLSDALNYALVIAGLILLFMLISGGFTLLTNPTNPQAQEGGKQRLTWAVAGFVLLFSSYWIVQILEIIFKVEIV